MLLYKSPKLDDAIQGKPVLLIYKGYVNEENLRKTRITFEELYEAVREHGVEEIKEVDLAMLERDGNISVLSDSFSKKTLKKRKSHRAVKQNTE